MSASPDVVVWSEIPVTDLTRARAFYARVLGLELTESTDGPNPTVFLTADPERGVAGHLYPGTPAAEGTGSTVHFAAPDALERTMERVREAGGRVVSEPIAIPTGRFFYALDPDGNSIGFFEA